MENTSLAEQLIQQNISTGARLLDLGNCGLSDGSPELALLESCTHIEVLNLGVYYYLNNKQVPCGNKGNSNQFTSVPRSLPPLIKELYINRTQVANLADITLYKQLTHFDCYGNNVEELIIPEPNANLISFGLSRNGIKNADAVENFRNLKYLYLGDNKLDSFLKRLPEILPRLETLYLYGNNLKELSFLSDHVSLKKLDVKNNNIIDIHALSTLSYLEEVDLTGNPIVMKMPQSVVQSRKAIEVRCWINGMSLPELLITDSKQKNESFLDLGNCGLSDSSPELKLLQDCSHLQSLSLGAGYYDEDSNYIKSEMRLAANLFTIVPPLLPPQLKHLQIRDSAIREISNVSHLVNLELLDLSNNKINKIENVEALGSLYELALHRNVIERIDNIRFPANVHVLHLSNNKIGSLKGIEKCRNLATLVIYNNHIRSIFPITALPHLREIDLSGNPVNDCPPEIWTNNNIKQIKAYFTERKRPEQAAKLSRGLDIVDDVISAPDIIDVKLIILGNSNVGKTNLVHYLETGNYLSTRNSTHGLEVKRWKPDVDRFPQLQNTEVSMWDFGGQEYYHDSYKLFLGSNAVYVVLWSMDSEFNGKRDETLHDNEPKVSVDHFDLQYWLDTVKSFRDENSNTPLIVVQNKVDEPQQKRRISQDLHAAYGINESFSVSLKNGSEQPGSTYARNLQNFTDYLADSLQELAKKNKEAQFSADFKYVRQEVLNLSEQGKASIFGNENDLYIDKESFYKICKQHRPGIQAEHYPVWLYNAGAVVYFEKNSLLNDRIFINPKKLSEEIYKVLNTKVLAGHGEIAIDEHTRSNQLVINVMISLNILYPHPAKQATHYLAPQYLPEDHPIEDLFKIASSNAWQDLYWVQVPLFFYKKLMHYLLLSFIADDNVDARYFWKNGIMILKKEEGRDPGKVVLIKGLFPSEKKGIIQVSVEDNSSGLQKDIFKRILGFTVSTSQNPNTVKSRGDSEQTVGRSAMPADQYFREKLAVSVDFDANEDTFIKYTDLERMAALPGSDTDNKLLKFKHIVPLDIKGAQPKTVFVSYSHSNTMWLAKLRNHLAGLRRSNYIKEWTDQEISAGDQWDKKIKEQLKKADVFILLLSAEFIASEYIWQTELTEAIESKKTIIPIYIESCDFSASPHIKEQKISDFEIIPKDSQNYLKPISLWANEAEALTVVAARIRAVVRGGV